MRRFKPRVLAWVLSLLLVLSLAGTLVFRSLGRWLVVRDKLETAEAAVVPTGELLERINAAVKIYQDGQVRYLVLTGRFPAFSVFKLKQIALEQGVPADRIITDDESEGTYQHARAVQAIARQKGWRSLILVTSPYHSRRAAWIFKKVLADDKIKVISRPAEPAWFQAEGWWRHDYSALEVRWEYKKLLFYYFYYGLLGKK